MPQELDWLAPKQPGMPALMALGTMNFGGRTPEAAAVQIMDRALERGVNWFDTADAYGGGEAERIVGRYLAGRNRDQVVIATKGGSEGLSAAAIGAAIDASLQRLKLEHINLYYLDAPDRRVPVAETLLVLEQARAAGKIGAWGLSNFASWRIAEIASACDAMKWPRPRVSQVVFNLLLRQLEIEYFDFAAHAGIHTTVYSPLACGLLAGKGLEAIEARPRPGSRDGMLTPRLAELAQAYAALAKEAGLEPSEFACAWLTRRTGVDSIVLGPATAEQLDTCIDGCEEALDDSMLAKIDAAHRACTGSAASYAL